MGRKRWRAGSRSAAAVRAFVEPVRDPPGHVQARGDSQGEDEAGQSDGHHRQGPSGEQHRRDDCDRREADRRQDGEGGAHRNRRRAKRTSDATTTVRGHQDAEVAPREAIEIGVDDGCAGDGRSGDGRIAVEHAPDLADELLAYGPRGREAGALLNQQREPRRRFAIHQEVAGDRMAQEPVPQLGPSMFVSSWSKKRPWSLRCSTGMLVGEMTRLTPGMRSMSACEPAGGFAYRRCPGRGGSKRWPASRCPCRTGGAPRSESVGSGRRGRTRCRSRYSRWRHRQRYWRQGPAASARSRATIARGLTAVATRKS